MFTGWLGKSPAVISLASVSILASAALTYELYALFPNPFVNVSQHSASNTAYVHMGSHYPGWRGIENVFVFGDSWSSTGFEEFGPQPRRDNPFGNPDFPGVTATNGPNWVGYLTATHNASFIRTVNLSYGGSTIDLELIHPDVPALRDLKYQIQSQFLPVYASSVQDAVPAIEWDRGNTLFGIWMGLNDIHNANANSSRHFEREWEEFFNHVCTLYDTGARNFLFLNIPPIQRSPLAVKIETVETWGTWVSEWNRNLTSMATKLMLGHEDATIVVFDTYTIWDKMVDSPCTFQKTCRFEDTSTFCWRYALGTPEWNTKDEECKYSVDKHLWMNDLHPTSVVFDVVAEEVGKVLKTYPMTS